MCARSQSRYFPQSIICNKGGEIDGKKGIFKIDGELLVKKVKDLIKEGNVRRITISKDNKEIVTFPLTVGVIGALIAPVLAAVGAVAALIGECTISIERE